MREKENEKEGKREEFTRVEWKCQKIMERKGRRMEERRELDDKRWGWENPNVLT